MQGLPKLPTPPSCLKKCVIILENGGTRVQRVNSRRTFFGDKILDPVGTKKVIREVSFNISNGKLGLEN